MKTRNDYTEREIIEAFASSVSIPDCAEKLDVNRKTLWTWLKKLGVDTTRKKYKTYTERDWGTFARWLRTNTAPLPHDFKQLAKMSGCSQKSVESYLYRRKKQLEQKGRKYVLRWMDTHTEWPDGSMILPEQMFRVNSDLWSHTVTVSPDRAQPFTIGVKAPNGYRRKN